MLNTEKNTVKVDRMIKCAVRSAVRDGSLPARTGDYVTFFEHGQWWIEHSPSGAQWSVCDEESARGFCFEQVAAGQEH